MKTIKHRLAALEARKQSPASTLPTFRVGFINADLQAESAMFSTPHGGWRDATPKELAEINAEFRRLNEEI
jgi:hypothetical protein